MFNYTIAPSDATGQNDRLNTFAYSNSGKRCKVVRKYNYTGLRDSGVRCEVQLEDGTRGTLWEDELERTCTKCDKPEWDCECEENF